MFRAKFKFCLKKVKNIGIFTCLNKRETKNILNLKSYLNNFHEPERSTRNLNNLTKINHQTSFEISYT